MKGRPSNLKLFNNLPQEIEKLQWEVEKTQQVNDVNALKKFYLIDGLSVSAQIDHSLDILHDAIRSIHHHILTALQTYQKADLEESYKLLFEQTINYFIRKTLPILDERMFINHTFGLIKENLQQDPQFLALKQCDQNFIFYNILYGRLLSGIVFTNLFTTPDKNF